MEQIWTILKTVACVIVFASPIVFFILFKRIQRLHGRLHEMSTDELRALAEKSPFLHCNKVLEELSHRNEDISFALPLLFSLAIDEKMAVQLIGWGGLRTYFSDKLPNLDFSKNRPTTAEKNWILSELDYTKSQQDAAADGVTPPLT